MRRFEVEPGQDILQRAGRGRDDFGVEGVAHGQLDHLMAGVAESFHGRFDRGGRATDDRLRLAVEVGDDDVAVDGVERGLDLVERREDRSHQPVVVEGHGGHLATAGGDGLECVGERQCARGHQRGVLAEAVAHDHVGSDAVGRRAAG